MTARADPRSKLNAVAERQAGYFTAAQAREAGYSRASQHYHQKVGNWRREGHGIYRLERFPPQPRASTTCGSCCGAVTARAASRPPCRTRPPCRPTG
jgi:hypothetical protein